MYRFLPLFIGAMLHQNTRIARRELRWLIIAVLLLVALPALIAPFTQAHHWYQYAHRKEGERGCCATA